MLMTWRPLRVWLIAAAITAAGCGGGGTRTCEQPTATGAPVAVLGFVGDTHGYRIMSSPQDADPLAAVASHLEGLDAFVFNQEGVIEAEPRPASACPPWPHQDAFHHPPWVLEHLVRAPVTVGTLANNHVLDCGPAALRETIDLLGLRGILTVGAGGDLAAACAPLRFRAGSLDVALLAFLAWPDETTFAAGAGVAGVARWTACDGAAQVAALRAEGAFVVVALHLHVAPGWTTIAPQEHIALVREVLAAGAHLVVGHGAHAPQAVLRAHDGVGLLSLGNFLFRQEDPTPEVGRGGLLARVAVHAAHVELRLEPTRLSTTGRPAPAQGADAEGVLDAVARGSALLGTCLARDEGALRLVIRRQAGPGPP